MCTAGACFGYSYVTIIITFDAVSGRYIDLTTVITYVMLVLVKDAFSNTK
jgi:hypothetical protein